jgi:non-specific serine/threonine protein kinase
MVSDEGGSGAPSSAALLETALAQRAPSPPAAFLHYRVLEMLGEGGMGAVYKAQDQRLERTVAIKRLARRAAVDEEARLRLLREARAASALSHPNIVTIFAIEEDDDGAFIVMEYLEGETLAARITRGPLEPAAVVAVGIEIADALACAHAAGLVHRDVKPANVILTTRGLAKVLDFGIAKSERLDLAAGGAMTASGMIVGTGPYMSPEQLRGHKLDGRSDVFALGAVLYEAATGRRAFPASDLATLIEQVTTLDPVPPRVLAPSLAAPLESIVLRALAKEPGRRFTSAMEMAGVLRDFARGATSRQAHSSQAPALPPSSIAVLSFLDLSAGHDQGYLCDGIAEEILSALTHVPGLRVAARSSSFAFKPEGADARAVGTRLGVDAVLEGAVRKAGDRLRVTVQLVEVADGYQRWSHRFDGTVADIFAIQDEIAASVATQLRGFLSTLSQNALRRPGTTPQAYECFLRGREQLRHVTQTAVHRGEGEIKRAIELDPGYAPAYAALAQLLAWQVEWYGGGDREADAADRASERAVELGPQLAESHVARGVVLSMRRDYVSAERQFQEALRINPQSFDAYYYYARVCFQTGKDEQAVELFRRGGEVQVEDFQCPMLGAQCLRRLGRREEAEAAGREGIRRAERLLELDPDNARALSLGAGHFVSVGDLERARTWMRRALAAAPDDFAVSFNAACCFFRLGDKEEGFASLEKTFGQGVGKRDWVEHDPDFDSVRDDPRFKALLSKLT